MPKFTSKISSVLCKAVLILLLIISISFIAFLIGLLSVIFLEPIASLSTTSPFLFAVYVGPLIAAALGMSIFLFNRFADRIIKYDFGQFEKSELSRFNGIVEFLNRLRLFLTKFIKNSKIYNFFIELKGLSPKQILNRLAAAALTLLRPPKVFITAPILILMALAIALVPPFIFNELEYKSRAQLYASYYLMALIEEPISFRRSNSQQILDEDSGITLEDYIAVGVNVENYIQGSLNFLNDSLDTIEQQRKIPLLGSKYRKFLDQKQQAFEELRHVSEFFLSMKKKQHMTSNTLGRLTLLQEQFGETTLGDEEWWQLIDKIPEEVPIIRSDVEELYQQAYITEDLYQYLSYRLELMNFLYQEASKVSQADDWEMFDAQGYLEAASKGEMFDIDSIFVDSNKIAEEMKAEYAVMFEKNDAFLYEVGNYYIKNDLALDPLSVLLSKFSHYFPRNYIETTEPVYVPEHEQPWRLGMAGPVRGY